MVGKGRKKVHPMVRSSTIGLSGAMALSTVRSGNAVMGGAVAPMVRSSTTGLKTSAMSSAVARLTQGAATTVGPAAPS